MEQSRIHDCPLWLALLNLSGVCGQSNRFHHPFFSHGVGTIAVQYWYIQLVSQHQLLDTAFKQIAVATVFAPFEMPFVNIWPMDFIAVCTKLIPLNTRMENIQNVAKNLVAWEFRLRPPMTTRQIPINEFIKLFPRYFYRQSSLGNRLWIIPLFHTNVLQISGKVLNDFLH